MEEHFLKEFVVGQTREKPRPWYNPEGDCIIYQMADEAIVADRIDEILTIYRSQITDKPIGYQIKGIAALAKLFQWDALLVQCKGDEGELKEISVSALLLVAYEQGPTTIGRRKAYADAFESCAEKPRLNPDDLRSVLALG